jgi:ATP-dependent DNA helicase PIF1
MSIILNDLQQRAFDYIISGENLFLTGSGGTGKSEIIKMAKFELERKYLKNVAITSMTGVSANIIGGKTLHSTLGIGLGNSSYKKLYKKIIADNRALAKWKRLDVLFVDEISMLSIELFEKLEKLARAIRKNDLPFGGINLIFSGDYLQLPPINQDKLLFESEVFKICMTNTVYLKEIMRQTDTLFTSVLNKIRICDIDDEVKELLQSREIKYKSTDGILPTMIYSTNAKVDKTNKFYYDKLEGEEFKYKLKENWKKKVIYKEKYDPLIRFQDEVCLKVGAQVIFQINTPDNPDLFNGSRGVVKDFIGGLPLVLFTSKTGTFDFQISEATLDIEEDDKVIMSYTQIPLKLGFAASVHRSQGSSLSLVRFDMANVFEYSQCYVAFSRVRTLEGLYIRNLNFNVIKSNPKCIEFYRQLELEKK